MATYTIIGGDQKEYGPVSDEEMRQWIGEGRLGAQSLVKSDADSAWRPLGSCPEFAALFAAETSPADDYELDIGGCVTRGWELFKSHLAPLFACCLIVGAIAAVYGGSVSSILSLATPKHLFASELFHLGFNLLLAIVMAVVVGPLMGGLYHVFLQAGRHQPVVIGEVFIGFQRSFKQLVRGYLVVSLVVSVFMIPYNVMNDLNVVPIIEKIQHASPTEVQNLVPQLWSAIFATLPLFFLCMIPVTYLTVNWQFTLPLIVDRQMEFWPAMKTSWTMVHKHWWHVFGLTVVVGLVSAAGILLCCVGVIFTIPIGIAITMSAYETIFGPGKK